MHSRKYLELNRYLIVGALLVKTADPKSRSDAAFTSEAPTVYVQI